MDTAEITSAAERWTLTAANPDSDNDPNTPNYENRYDVNLNEVINVIDIQKVASHWNLPC